MNYEKLNDRDLRYSKLHRSWGKKLYMFDADSIEYNSQGFPVAMVELKHGAIETVDLQHFEIKCLRNTCSKLDIPLFICCYYPTGEDLKTHQVDRFGKHWQFYVIAANQKAATMIPEPRKMHEAEYVSFLYWLRKEKKPSDLQLDATYIDVPLPHLLGSPIG